MWCSCLAPAKKKLIAEWEKKMESINRRDFLKGSVGAATAAAQNKVVLGVMGVGGRGRALLTSLVKRSDVKIKYICDADTRCYGPAAEIVIESHDYKPKFVQDFRKILDDPEDNGLPGGKRCLRGKAAVAEHLGRQKNG